MSDLEALQGLWRIQSMTSGGNEVGALATHYLIVGDSMKEIVPSDVDDGKLRTSFVLDESTSPRRLTLTLDYNGPDGPPDPDPIVVAYVYRLERDMLTLCSGIMGEFPDDLSDEFSITVLMRDHGPGPETRKPSGTPPLVDDVVGTLEWDDNLHWYSRNVDLGETVFRLTLRPVDGTEVSAALARARVIVQDIEAYRQLAANYAVKGLLGTKNEWWLDEHEAELSADDFKSRMTLRSITVKSDGCVTFWHDDGDMFRGHSIQVDVDANDNCTGTDIPG
jgi:uncharacterized protein (TIGR03067 family)